MGGRPPEVRSCAARCRGRRHVQNGPSGRRSVRSHCGRRQGDERVGFEGRQAAWNVVFLTDPHRCKRRFFGRSGEDHELAPAKDVWRSTPQSRATLDAVAPACSVSSTICRFSSSGKQRRRFGRGTPNGGRTGAIGIGLALGLSLGRRLGRWRQRSRRSAIASSSLNRTRHRTNDLRGRPCAVQ
jgi:hypothetical protein